jgi:hypothetical protein
MCSPQDLQFIIIVFVFMFMTMIGLLLTLAVIIKQLRGLEKTNRDIKTEFVVMVENIESYTRRVARNVFSQQSSSSQNSGAGDVGGDVAIVTLQ